MSPRHFIIQEGNEYYIREAVPQEAKHEFAPGTYDINCDTKKGFFLSKVDNLQAPKRIYGNTHNLVDRWIRSFENNDVNLAVLLHGLKGSGKTLALKLLAQKFVEMSYIVLLLQRPLAGADLNTFLSSIAQPCLVICDEFDKLYGPNEREANDSHHEAKSQNSFLSLLQGVVSGKKLFAFTVNDIKRVSEFLINRPGRVRYVVPYQDLEHQAIIDYVQETLKDCTKEKLVDIFCIKEMTKEFNFDMLKAIVEEMNAFNEDAYTASRYMISQKALGYYVARITVTKEGHEPFSFVCDSRGFNSNNDYLIVPLAAEGDERVDVGPQNLINNDLINNEFFYENDGFKVHMRREKETRDWPVMVREPEPTETQRRQGVKAVQRSISLRNEKPSSGGFTFSGHNPPPSITPPKADGDQQISF